MPKGISREEMAANYGWALSFLKSNKELWRLFNKAVDKSWSVNRFVAAMRNTKWFKKHSDTYRKMQVLRKTDPKTFNQRLSALEAKISDMGVQVGADFGPKIRRRIAMNALYFDWNDHQIRNTLANYVDQMGSSGHYGGEAGKAEDELRQYADDMGIRLSEGGLKRWLTRIVANQQTTGDYKAYIQGLAEQSYSIWADRIRAGHTVRELAEPYMQLMSQTLEINPGEIKLSDPSIRRALQTVGPDGKPVAKTLWQYQEDLKKDPRWLQTNNARESLLSAGQQILKDFGFR